MLCFVGAVPGGFLGGNERPCSPDVVGCELSLSLLLKVGSHIIAPIVCNHQDDQRRSQRLGAIRGFSYDRPESCGSKAHGQGLVLM